MEAQANLQESEIQRLGTDGSGDPAEQSSPETSGKGKWRFAYNQGLVGTAETSVRIRRKCPLQIHILLTEALWAEELEGAAPSSHSPRVQEKKTEVAFPLCPQGKQASHQGYKSVGARLASQGAAQTRMVNGICLLLG